MTTIDQTYPKVERMVQQIVWRFRANHGGEFDELMAEASLHFVRAYEEYEEGHGATPLTWVRFKVTKGLLETARQMSKREALLPRTELDWDCQPQPSRFDIERFLADLSEDAQTTVRLIIEPPPDVIFNAHQSYGPNNPQSLRAAVEEFLADIGWGVERITESFSEIAEAL